jgi:hypothetical protein
MSVAISASFILAWTGCRVPMHTLVGDLVTTDDGRQRSMDSHNLLHDLHQLVAVPLDDRNR